MMPDSIRIGTRGSRLALWQAGYVAERLAGHGLRHETVVLSTSGDRDLDTPLPQLGDKALFTAELDAALLAGEIDLAVHSLKDLPTALTEGLELTAVPVRAEPWDVLVARDRSLAAPDELPRGGTVATSSLRRAAQLLHWRADLRVVPVRGNVETRLRRLHENGWDGIILAEAGLARLGMADVISARFDPSVMLPGVSQGALGVVCALGPVSAALRGILDDPAERMRVAAERAFLGRLEGGCQVPIGALCTDLGDGTLSLEGVVAAVDGSSAFRGLRTGSSSDPEGLGAALAEELLARGADRVLSDIREAGR